MISAIGQGASGDVYQAQDRYLDRRVAVKVLHSSLARDEVFLRRFRSEAKLAAGLTHPSIMAVYDWGESEEAPYLVLELLSGGSLREHLADGRLFSISQVTMFAQQTASGLAYAHQKRYIHRDLKPANLLFDAEGRIRIADFGLARALSEAAWTEPVGVLIGTAKYASPEQARGIGAGERSDVYSLGLVMYESIAHSLPFTGSGTIELLMARVDKVVRAPAEAGVLGTIIEECLRQDPEARPTALEISRRLEMMGREMEPPVRIAPFRRGPYDREPIPQDADLTRRELLPVGDEARTIDFRQMTAAELFDIEAPELAPEWRTTGIASAVEFADMTDMGHRTVPELRAPEVPVSTSPPKRQGGGRNWRRIWAVVVPILIVVMAVGGYFGYRAVFMVRVPTFSTSSLSAAEATLVKAKLKPVVTSKIYSSTVASGSIISFSPKWNTLVGKDSQVSLVVSKGHAPLLVPGVGNDTPAQAQTVLTTAGFVVAVVDNYSETIPAGQLISVTPAPGTSTPYGSTITLSVSKGPAPRVLPSVLDESQATATTTLEALGLNVVITTDYSTVVTSGNVITQSVPAGQSVPKGSTVTLDISMGVHMATIPNVLNLPTQNAKSILQSQGFVVTVIPVGSQQGAIVLKETPSQGTSVQYGSNVTIYVG